MENLSLKDWRLLTGAVDKLNSDFDSKTLPARALEALAILVPGGVNSFDFFSRHEKYNGTAWQDSGDLLNASVMEVFAKYIHEHALVPISLENPNLGALKMTDIITQKEFEKTGLYNEFYRRLNLRYQVGVSLPIAGDLTICGVVTRGDRDFTERDKTLLTLAAPHIINAVRNGLAYERLSAALETTACGVIALNSAGRTVFTSEFAQDLCERYFAGEKLVKGSLPEKIHRWLAQTAPVEGEMTAKTSPKPFKIENLSGTLLVRLMDNTGSGERTVLLEEKTFSSPKMFERLPVTPREAEILFWITQGKTDDVIAGICHISRRTVHKHIENIYKKLGVETRTSAMLKVLEII